MDKMTNEEPFKLIPITELLAAPRNPRKEAEELIRDALWHLEHDGEDCSSVIWRLKDAVRIVETTGETVL